MWDLGSEDKGGKVSSTGDFSCKRITNHRSQESCKILISHSDHHKEKKKKKRSGIQTTEYFLAESTWALYDIDFWSWPFFFRFHSPSKTKTKPHHTTSKLFSNPKLEKNQILCRGGG